MNVIDKGIQAFQKKEINFILRSNAYKNKYIEVQCSLEIKLSFVIKANDEKISVQWALSAVQLKFLFMTVSLIEKIHVCV